MKIIKKFLSFVALSATLISPVLADDFVPLRYYEAEPLPIIQTKPTYLYEERISANTMGVRGLYGGNTTIDSGIRQAILNGDIVELELLLNEKALSATVISAIIAAVEKGDTNKAFDILSLEDTQSVRWDNDDNHSNSDTPSWGGSSSSSGGAMPPDWDKQKKGKPQSNTAQNRQVNDAARSERLTPQQRQALGRAVERETRDYGHNLSYHDIRQIARDIKNGVY